MNHVIAFALTAAVVLVSLPVAGHSLHELEGDLNERERYA